MNCFLNTGILWRTHPHTEGRCIFEVGKTMKTIHKVAYYTYCHILRGEFLKAKDLNTRRCCSCLCVNTPPAAKECPRIAEKNDSRVWPSAQINTAGQQPRGGGGQKEILTVKQGRTQSCLNCTCSGVDERESATLELNKLYWAGQPFTFPASPTQVSCP